MMLPMSPKSRRRAEFTLRQLQSDVMGRARSTLSVIDVWKSKIIPSSASSNAAVLAPGKVQQPTKSALELFSSWSKNRTKTAAKLAASNNSIPTVASSAATPESGAQFKIKRPPITRNRSLDFDTKVVTNLHQLLETNQKLLEISQSMDDILSATVNEANYLESNCGAGQQLLDRSRRPASYHSGVPRQQLENRTTKDIEHNKLMKRSASVRDSRSTRGVGGKLASSPDENYVEEEEQQFRKESVVNAKLKFKKFSRDEMGKEFVRQSSTIIEELEDDELNSQATDESFYSNKSKPRKKLSFKEPDINKDSYDFGFRLRSGSLDSDLEVNGVINLVVCQ